MATISQQQQQSSPSPPSVPSPQALASRGRRPALIPHNADLSLSLSAAATALGMASYSPNRARGTSGNSGSLLWVLPSSSPPTAAWSGDLLETRWKEDGQMCDIDLDDDQREAVRSLVVKDVFSWVNEMDSDQPRSQLQKTKIPETAPTSPMSGNFPEELDFRRRRLQEAERDIRSKQ